jgi:hypothetical protein
MLLPLFICLAVPNCKHELGRAIIIPSADLVAPCPSEDSVYDQSSSTEAIKVVLSKLRLMSPQMVQGK